jgi:hypothetical protein
MKQSFMQALTIISLFMIPSKMYSQESLNHQVIEGYNLLQKGADTNNKDLLLQAHTILKQASMKAPDNSFVTYALGYAEYKFCTYAFAKSDTGLFNIYSDSVIVRMEKIKSDPHLKSDASAILGVTYGMKIASHPMDAAVLGPKSFNEINVAVETDSSNPRAWLVLGQFQLEGPKSLGGGPEKAIESFARAIRCAEIIQIRDSLAPRWGLLEAYIWSGDAAAENNDPKSAISFYHRALQISPDNLWVKNELLPEAEEKLNRKK